MTSNVIRGALLLVATLIVGGCNNTTTPSGPSPILTGSTSGVNLTGTWMGQGSDSSSSTMGSGSMMGQAGIGQMTVLISESGSSVSGTVAFSGMPNLTPGSLTGTLSGNIFTFTITMPAGSMLTSGCSVTANGTLQVNVTTMTGAFSGSNSCDGAFTNGQMTLTKR